MSVSCLSRDEQSGHRWHCPFLGPKCSDAGSTDRLAPSLSLSPPPLHPRLYRETVTEQLKNMPFAPSAQMQKVPHDISDDDLGESDSELEERITRESGYGQICLGPDCEPRQGSRRVHRFLRNLTES